MNIVPHNYIRYFYVIHSVIECQKIIARVNKNKSFSLYCTNSTAMAYRPCGISNSETARNSCGAVKRHHKCDAVFLEHSLRPAQR